MPKYSYHAIKKSGKTVEGSVDAQSSADARSILELQGMSLLSLREQRKYNINLSFSLHISKKEIAFFTKNFAIMLEAGLTVVDALIIMEAQAHGRLRKIIHSILQHVESGYLLADGFAKHKRIFSGTYVDVIRNGEISGNLSSNMQKLALRLESDLSLRRKIYAALIYPIMVVVAIIALVIILSVYVLPRLIRLFESLDIELPTATKIMLWIAEFVSAYWLFLIIGAVVAVVMFNILIAIPSIRYYWHKIILRLPVTGTISRNVNLAFFAGTLGSLLKSGMPISDSMQSVVQSVTNDVYREYLKAALVYIEQGGNLSAFLEKKKRLFPVTVTRMISVGERTGKLDEILLYLGNYYEVEVDTSTKQISTTIEPALLFVIGAAVLFVGLSIVTPVYQFTASVGRI